ncbi:MAG: TIM-barrel domain-containing protein [Bacteroidota bacterium]
MAQHSRKLSQRLGSIESIQSVLNGFNIIANYGRINITSYKDNIVRVHIFKGDPQLHSYAVNFEPVGEMELLENEEKYIFKTEALNLELSKANSTLTFKNTKGQTVNEDDKTLGVSWIGEQITNYKSLQQGERFIGLGEKTGNLNRRGKAYQHWNTDQYAYDKGTDPLYCSTPFYIGLHSGLCYGIFLDNSYKSNFNFGASNDRFSSFSVDSGDLNYYFIYGETVAEIIKHYTALTGRMPLPPIWSIGYQQCRYSYYPDKEVLSLANTFQEKQIPADVIVLDIHYMENFKIFTWDEEHFKNPKEMILALREKGFHVVVMCDPGIKIEEGYEPYESGLEDDVFVKYPDGTYYSGEVWPGWCHFPDFTDSTAREWWKNKLQIYTDIEIDGFWNDMNEIATWGNALPELIEFEFDGNRTTTREARNVYGMLMSKSTYEGAKALLKGKRPFNLTRAGFSGVQRYAAVWTGDNIASDEHLMLGIRLVNSMGLAGITFAGYDVGGFVGNASEYLFARWIQVGAFTPFFRGHSMVNSRDSEPWSYGEEVEEISRNFIRLRYLLMPYLYSCFYESSQTGMPVSRTLAINYPEAPQVYEKAYQQQFLFGPSILVIPVESTKEFAKVYLPEGEWYNFFTDELENGNSEKLVEASIEIIPIYIKGSAILPMVPEIGLNTSQLGEILELHIYEGKINNTFEFYYDDGNTFDYEKGHYHKRLLTYSPSSSTLEISEASGSLKTDFQTLRICFHGFDLKAIEKDGRNLNLNYMDYRYIQPISNFDPIGSPGGDFKLKDLPYIEVPYGNEAFNFTIINN